MADLTAHTYCVFGMSSPLDKVGPGRHFTLYHPKASVIAFTGLNGRIFWFIFRELEAPLPYSERRKWGEEDSQAAYDICKDLVFTEGVKFSDVWATTEYKVTLTVEQGICESFYAGRMFLLGDAAHKVSR
jgi:FAD dependent monooxygenase